MLISGGQQGLDIEDMRAHVQYSGGYHEVGSWQGGPGGTSQDRWEPQGGMVLRRKASAGKQAWQVARLASPHMWPLHRFSSAPLQQEHPVILEFWRALATFSPQEQADFLRFITSCPRPPLLGFRWVRQSAGQLAVKGHGSRVPCLGICYVVRQNKSPALDLAVLPKHHRVLCAACCRYLEPPLAIQASWAGAGADSA